MPTRKILFMMLFCLPTVIKAQSLVFGGFASFSISDTTFSVANAGGAITYTDTITKCLMVQGGNIFGRVELFEKVGAYNDECIKSKKSSTISVYPNPSNGIYWIQGKEIVLVEVFDNLGRKIISQEYLQNKEFLESINISPAAEGNYFLQIFDAKGHSWVSSIIKLNQ